MIMQHQQAKTTRSRQPIKMAIVSRTTATQCGRSLYIAIHNNWFDAPFNIDSQESLLSIYLFQSVMYLAFLSLAQVFVIAFGNMGMIFNICALSLQLVTSGVLVPKPCYLKDTNRSPPCYLPRMEQMATTQSSLVVVLIISCKTVAPWPSSSS